MDNLLYQRLPACIALQQPRPRILIADSTGLGKTLEAGILISELIRRGRGRRILVVTLKSMLTQFQQELWSRFTIPLVRLDSIGIERVRNKLPVGHNPFNHFAKSIISIDTLKSAGEYRVFVENAYWDIIVIDEAQNVAKRGTRSLRHQLADLLASRSDTLIMLSATPHDGKSRSFASLIDMLDPTVIIDPDNYTKEDLEGKNLFIRRFKKDILHEARFAFPKRKTHKIDIDATPAEEKVFALLADTSNELLSARVEGGWLLRTVLEKALLSSPHACLETIQARIKRLKKQKKDPKFIRPLVAIEQALQQLQSQTYSKYRRLLTLLREWRWNGSDSNDRVVIFTERIATQKFLEERLKQDLKLKPEAINSLHGTLSDQEQQEIVDAFGSEQKPVRLLISTDVGSEGINLHYRSCKLIHFDIPWSIMLLQQRNGRIDRYGQERTPHIAYLLTRSLTEKFKDDRHIFKLLITKEEQAHQNIGDPASLMQQYEIVKEVDKVRKAKEKSVKRDYIEDFLFGQSEAAENPIDEILQLQPKGSDGVVHNVRSLPSLFHSDYDYLKTALGRIKQSEKLKFTCWDSEQRTQVHLTDALKRAVVDTLPVEARPRNKVFDLTGQAKAMMTEIKRCRAAENTWPRLHYLWALHPLVEWTTDKVRALFLRREAPLVISPALRAQEFSYIIDVQYPNLKGHTVYNRWYVVHNRSGQWDDVVPFEHSQEFRTLKNSRLPNMGCSKEVIDHAHMQLSEAVDRAVDRARQDVQHYWEQINPKLQKHLDNLKALEKRKEAFVQRKFDRSDQLAIGMRNKAMKEIKRNFKNYKAWIGNTMQVAREELYVQVVAVLAGA